MHTIFLDESEQAPVYGVGGFFIKDDLLNDLEESYSQIKAGMGLLPGDPLKWSLSRRAKHQEVRLKLKKQNIRPLLCRERILNFISQAVEFVIIVALLEDRRPEESLDRKASTLYSWAFKFLLQRAYYHTEKILMENPEFTEKVLHSRIKVIVDRPPADKDKTLYYHKIYQKAYYEGFRFERNQIPPLKQYFYNTLLVSHSDYCSFIQLADFCVGATVYWAKANLSRRNMANAKRLLKLIFSKFRRVNEELIGYGIVGFPPNSSLYYGLSSWVTTLEAEIGDDEEVSF